MRAFHSAEKIDHIFLFGAYHANHFGNWRNGTGRKRYPTRFGENQGGWQTSQRELDLPQLQGLQSAVGISASG